MMVFLLISCFLLLFCYGLRGIVINFIEFEKCLLLLKKVISMFLIFFFIILFFLVFYFFIYLLFGIVLEIVMLFFIIKYLMNFGGIFYEKNNY